MFFCPAEQQKQKEVQLEVVNRNVRTRRNFKKLVPEDARVRPTTTYSKMGHAMKQRYDIYRTTDTVAELLEKGITRKVIVSDLDKGYVEIVYKDQS